MDPHILWIWPGWNESGNEDGGGGNRSHLGIMVCWDDSKLRRVPTNPYTCVCPSAGAHYSLKPT